MKGTIVKCLEELVTEKFGQGNWEESLRLGGVVKTRKYSTFEDVADAEVLAILKGVSATSSLPVEGVMEAFGEYWSTVYAPRIYEAYYSGAKNAREFLLDLDRIHTGMTKTLKLARPPHFRYEWRGEQHLVMHYQSGRGLVALMPGLIRGVGKYYREYLNVSVAGNAVHIRFS